MVPPPAPSGGPGSSEATVDLPLHDSTAKHSRADVAAECEQNLPLALNRGGSTALVGEIAALLRQRLRLAGVLMLFGVGAFLVRHGLEYHPAYPGAAFLLGAHVLMTLVLAVLVGVLYRSKEISLSRLRACELVVFGLPLAFVLVTEYSTAVEFARRGDFQLEISPYLLLMYTYALFIPNTHRRAVTVIVVMAAAPIGLMLVLWTMVPSVSALMTPDHLAGLPLVMVLAAAGSIMGVDTIGSLRREAFEARQLGQYRLKRLLGSGGMGVVYLAEHQLLKRPCVIKLIQPSKAGDPTVLARFQREVQATARLSHWNTVEIFDYGVTVDGTFYYAMEYLPGMSLAEVVQRHGPLPPERAIYLLRQTCDALREAHSMGLIHRDIKPGNIFVAQRGGVFDVAKLLDFGLVKPLNAGGPLQLTTEGLAAGSPLFMSPEQAMGDANPDARSDIYAMGAVAYYVLTGHAPFEKDTAMKILMAHVGDEVVPPSTHRADLPPDLEQVVLKCLAKAPIERYQDAVSLDQALSQCGAAGGWSRERAAQWWQAVEPAAASV